MNNGDATGQASRISQLSTTVRCGWGTPAPVETSRWVSHAHGLARGDDPATGDDQPRVVDHAALAVKRQEPVGIIHAWIGHNVLSLLAPPPSEVRTLRPW